VARNLKNKSKVAIVNIASDNRAEGTFVIEEFTELCVNSKKPKLQVIDRRKIESIRIAKNFDRTSDMEDDFVISIGSLLGADYVITGDLNGSGQLRRFRVRVLNVRTGIITAMATAAV
jgi:predicted nucleic acid-binding protein